MKGLIMMVFVYFIVLTTTAQEGTGYMPEKRENLANRPFSFFANTDTLPQKIDWSSYLPPVGDQGTASSCVSWVVGYELLGFLQAKNLQAKNGKQFKYGVQKTDFEIMNEVFGDFIPDASQVPSPGFLYNLHQTVFEKPECYNGMEFAEAFELFNKYGCPRYEDYPYLKDECSYSVSKKAMQRAFVQPNRLVYNAIPIIKGTTITGEDIANQIKAQLANGRVVLLGIEINNSFRDGLTKDSVWQPVTAKLPAKHAVLCVGYDKTYFKLMNTWGRDFGKNGYFYMTQESIVKSSKVFLQGFIAEFIPNNLPKPTFSNLASKNDFVRIGQYVENKSVKYQLMAIDDDSSAIISALSSGQPNGFSFRIRVKETKKIEVRGEEYYFTYNQLTFKPNEAISISFNAVAIQPPSPSRTDKKATGINVTLSAVVPTRRTETTLDSAKKVQQQAFTALNNGQIEEAQYLFYKTDDVYPEFQSAYEISNYLRQELLQTPPAKLTPDDVQRIQQKVQQIDMFKRNKPDDIKAIIEN